MDRHNNIIFIFDIPIDVYEKNLPEPSNKVLKYIIRILKIILYDDFVQQLPLKHV